LKLDIAKLDIAKLDIAKLDIASFFIAVSANFCKAIVQVGCSPKIVHMV
jgi:hypothetical protein